MLYVFFFFFHFLRNLITIFEKNIIFCLDIVEALSANPNLYV